MDRANNQPRVFISSTILDFRDLRSALKFWLEEFGLRVLMSEFSDFDRRPDQGTFDSCFEAIATCHYYVLLVGFRRGSSYRDGVSVTRQEFRVARDLARQGRIKPVILVRSELLQSIRDARDAATPAAEGSSAVASEFDQIRQFVEEIRNSNVSPAGEEPSGTLWTYSFSDFRDVVDALCVNLRLFGTVIQKALLQNLAWELRANIGVFCENHGGTPDCGLAHADPLRQLQGERLDGQARTIGLDRATSGAFMRFMIAGMPLGSTLSTTALDAAISSGAFMVFSQEAERLVPGPELEAMLALRRDFETYRSHSRWQQQRLPEFEMQWNLRQQITLSTIEIALFAAVADLIRNIMRRSLSLLDLAANDGQRFEPADLIFSAPFGEAVFHDAQAVLTSQEDVERWRIDNALRRRLTD